MIAVRTIKTKYLIMLISCIYYLWTKANLKYLNITYELCRENIFPPNISNSTDGKRFKSPSNTEKNVIETSL